MQIRARDHYNDDAFKSHSDKTAENTILSNPRAVHLERNFLAITYARHVVRLGQSTSRRLLPPPRANQQRDYRKLRALRSLALEIAIPAVLILVVPELDGCVDCIANQLSDYYDNLMM